MWSKVVKWGFPGVWFLGFLEVYGLSGFGGYLVVELGGYGGFLLVSTLCSNVFSIKRPLGKETIPILFGFSIGPFCYIVPKPKKSISFFWL